MHTTNIDVKVKYVQHVAVLISRSVMNHLLKIQTDLINSIPDLSITVVFINSKHKYDENPKVGVPSLVKWPIISPQS